MSKLSIQRRDQLLADYERKGYCIVERDECFSVTDDAAMFSRLRAVADKVISKAQCGGWAHVRRNSAGDVWGVNNICNPTLGGAESSQEFLQYLALDGIIGVCALLLGSNGSDATLEDIQFELGNLLCMPHKPYSLSWHRDYVDIRALHDQEELAELERQRKLHTGVQWNTALYEDSCFVFVPNSHLRSKSKEEQGLIMAAASLGGNEDIDLPDQVVLTLHEGQTVFYDANLLHRGVYCGEPTARATLHFCVGHRDRGHHRMFIVDKSDGFAFTHLPEFLSILPEKLRPTVDCLWLNHLRAEREFGATQMQASVDAHNARPDVNKFGLVGCKEEVTSLGDGNVGGEKVAQEQNAAAQ